MADPDLPGRDRFDETDRQFKWWFKIDLVKLWQKIFQKSRTQKSQKESQNLDD